MSWSWHVSIREVFNFLKFLIFIFLITPLNYLIFFLHV